MSPGRDPLRDPGRALEQEVHGARQVTAGGGAGGNQRAGHPKRVSARRCLWEWRRRVSQWQGLLEERVTQRLGRRGAFVWVEAEQVGQEAEHLVTPPSTSRGVPGVAMSRCLDRRTQMSQDVPAMSRPGLAKQPAPSRRRHSGHRGRMLP